MVFPAHDYKGETVSTIGEEKAFNPRLQVKSVDHYVEVMNNLNLPNPKMMDVAVPANMKVGLAQDEIARRGWALSAKEAAALVFQTTLLFQPGLFSQDIFSYIAYGRLAAIYDLNPYVWPPSAIPRDAVLPWVAEVWRTYAAPYGPVWLDVQWLLARAIGSDSIVDQALAYRLLANALLLANLGLAWLALGRLTLLDHAQRATALALCEVPDVNIQVHGEEIHRFPDANIAVAVATDRGLITPVLRAAQAKPVHVLAAELKPLVDRARAGRLRSEDVEGGSFTVSNLGMFGVEQFDAIINPPQGAILAIGAATRQPMERDGAIAFANFAWLSLSCDHRAIDGAVGGRFLAALREMIESPQRL